MKKILTIGSNDVAFECNAVTPFLYRQQFKSDFFADIMKLSVAMSGMVGLSKLTENSTPDFTGMTGNEFDNIEFDVITNFAWACAKTADRKTKPLLEWLEENPEFNPLSQGMDIVELVTGTLDPKKK